VHGDGLSSHGDTGYLALRATLRNPWTIRLLRLVHPDIAYALGHRLSKLSREHLTARSFRILPALARNIDATLALGYDAFIMGHLHARHTERRPGGGWLFILGDWMSLFSALRLENGEFVWEDWSGGVGVDATNPEATLRGGHGDEPATHRSSS
jgi:UDP-2,3-diacylglucosamine pyrophosphatase LpxH